MSIRLTLTGAETLCTRCQRNLGRETILGASSGQLAGSRVLWCRPCIIRSKIAHAETVSATLPTLKRRLAEGGEREIAEAEALTATLPALRRRLAEAETTFTGKTPLCSSWRTARPPRQKAAHDSPCCRPGIRELRRLDDDKPIHSVHPH